MTLRKMKLVDTPTNADRRGKLNNKYLLTREKVGILIKLINIALCGMSNDILIFWCIIIYIDNLKNQFSSSANPCGESYLIPVKSA